MVHALPLRGPFGHILLLPRRGNEHQPPLGNILLLPRRGVPQRVAPKGHELSDKKAKPIDNDAIKLPLLAI